MDLLVRANRLYEMLPSYLQYAVDIDEDSGLEPDEVPDGYARMHTARPMDWDKGLRSL
jgi:hypothetical protein